MDDLDATCIPWATWSEPVPEHPAMRQWADAAHATLFLELLAGQTALQRRYDTLREELRRYTAAAVLTPPPPRTRTPKARARAFPVSASLGVR